MLCKEMVASRNSMTTESTQLCNHSMTAHLACSSTVLIPSPPYRILYYLPHCEEEGRFDMEWDHLSYEEFEVGWCSGRCQRRFFIKRVPFLPYLPWNMMIAWKVHQVLQPANS